MLATACTGGSQAPSGDVRGVVGFDAALREARFPPPQPDVTSACGSDRAQYASELLTTAPQDTQVPNEWGPIVPGSGPASGGREDALMPAQGVVTGAHLPGGSGFFSGDLPFTHPFGGDFTTNIRLDRSFSGLARRLGTAPNDIPSGTLHSELPVGLFPHDGAGRLRAEYVPRDGDRIATAGTWVVDCGHPDFHTELHDMQMLAFGHADGSSTVSHAFAAPYDVTNLFTIDRAAVTRFDDEARLRPGEALPIGPYTVRALAAVYTGALRTDHLLAHNVVVPAPTAWPPWYVCAPHPRAAGEVEVRAAFVVRPGVSVSLLPDTRTGCVRFRARASSTYRPGRLAPPGGCPISWFELQRLAGEAGVAGFELQRAIADRIPAGLRARIDPLLRNAPVFDCFRPFPTPDARPTSPPSIVVDAAQPFPFLGVAVVSRR